MEKHRLNQNTLNLFSLEKEMVRLKNRLTEKGEEVTIGEDDMNTIEHIQEEIKKILQE